MGDLGVNPVENEICKVNKTLTQNDFWVSKEINFMNTQNQESLCEENFKIIIL